MEAAHKFQEALKLGCTNNMMNFYLGEGCDIESAIRLTSIVFDTAERHIALKYLSHASIID